MTLVETLSRETQLMQLLNADYVMPQDTAFAMMQVADSIQERYSDIFEGFFVGGSTTNGGAVAKAMIENVTPRDGVSDIDYGLIVNRELSAFERSTIHSVTTQELEKRGYYPCNQFNVKNYYLPLNYPENLPVWIHKVIQSGVPNHVRYISIRLAMVFGVVFPRDKSEQLQQIVIEGLQHLAEYDQILQGQIVTDIEKFISNGRIIKKKHVPDDQIRVFINANRIL